MVNVRANGLRLLHAKTKPRIMQIAIRKKGQGNKFFSNIVVPYICF
uniref:Uncharacterized protein n=1 Tax=Klebsiella pneumoniae TaxID=573 RepID=A0A8B0SNJ9_KLEPN|nr:hypothetical protein [Klebsiella pneumoniae]